MWCGMVAGNLEGKSRIQCTTNAAGDRAPKLQKCDQFLSMCSSTYPWVCADLLK